MRGGLRREKMGVNDRTGLHGSKCSHFGPCSGHWSGDVRKTNVTTQIRGTMSHIASKYLSTRKSSERTDVFGYGIMLIDLVTGQHAIGFSRLEEDEDLLLDYVRLLKLIELQCILVYKL